MEFYGVNNAKFDLIRRAFSKLKLVPRGSKIKVSGKPEDIALFQDKTDEIVDFLQRYGSMTSNHVEELLAGLRPTNLPSKNEGVITYGPHGNVIKARTPNQQRLVNVSEKNDIVFAIGPAGTGKTYTAVALAVRALKKQNR